MSKKKKVVVTGGAGFIGSHLVGALLADGYAVHSVDNYAGGKIKGRFHKGAIYHNVDVTDTKRLLRLFKDTQYVFHAAALPRVQFSIDHPLKSNRANVEGTLSVLFAAQKAGVKRVIYSASSSAYGDQDTMPLKESMSTRPKSPYGLQKLIGEMYCKVFSEVYGLSTVSLRYFNVYGPVADPNGAYALVVAKFIEMRKKGKPMTVTGDGTQTRDFTHVYDVVRANILAAKSKKVGKGEIINIGAGKNASVNRVARLIGGPTKYIAARLEPHDTLADNKLAERLLGWSPKVSLEDGIAELKKLAGLV